jgi:hypothetical protein
VLDIFKMTATNLFAYQRIQQMPVESRKDFDAIFNGNYLEDIPDQLTTWHSRRVVLVVSKSLNENTDKVKRLEEKLGGLIVDKKAGVGSHSPYRGET